MDEDRCSISLQSVSSGWMLTPDESVQGRRSADDFSLVVDSDTDKDYDDDSSSVSTTSVDASLYEHEFDHDRRYHKFRSGRHPFPNDQQEQDLEETLHAVMLEVTEGHLFYSDVGGNPQSIIDIGTGRGTWATDAADMYPSANVVATDLSPIQPTWLPVNMRVLLEDCEDKGWYHGPGIDLAHFRNVASTLQDLDSVIQRVYDNLKPGGWIEFQDLEPTIYHDSPLASPDSLADFFEIATQGVRAFGYPSYPRLPPALYQSLARANFANIQIITKKVPLGTWPRDKTLHTAGFLAREAVGDLIESMAAKPLAALDLEGPERVGLVRAAKAALKDEDEEERMRYMKMHFVFAQKVAPVEDDAGAWVSSAEALSK